MEKSQSLRDISNGLRSATGNLNHLGNVHPPTKSNLGYQNKHRTYELFRDYYYNLSKHLGQQAGFKQVIELITNNFRWSCNTISELYKSRWQIEIFFREIKQLLHIKSFIGTSPNAVMIQIWTALITILILKYLKAIAKHKWYLSNLEAFLRINLFVKINLQKWLDEPFIKKKKPPNLPIQGVLFDF